ncbi:type III secretion system cytoplasmic ring protein SctQ [Labrys sp. ZIDIC5]|uniref:type III secretion system cytoplasmic ring protein SctQ n=1 Tax=Labrys sedimenti TaxID=3106036 RepID=UPI002ACA5964|nr:type III secretion system cytoplasmic ring protein SctQ [Labrys sp. ZIDIC5]MDZ5453361.1 type III secretion system cytoplasmic ring protein SctQ [Labrys sp. ZIDIC5]
MHQRLAALGKTRQRPAAEATVSAARLQAIAPADAAALNAFYRNRPPVKIRLAGEEFLLSALWQPVMAPGATTVIDFKVGAATGRLCLTPALFERWLARANPGVTAGPPAPAHSALLLESFLREEIAWLEQQLDGTIELIAATSLDGRPEMPFRFGLRPTGQAESICLLQADAALATRIGRILDAASGRPAAHRLELPLPVSLWWAATSLSVGELRSLQPGDIVMTDGWTRGAQTVLVVLAGRRAALAEPIGQSGRLVSAPMPISKTRWGWIMDEPQSASGQPDDTGLGDLPVTVVFELARMTMPLREVSRLAAGSIVPLPELSEPAVDLVANGKRIGRGEIVKVGDGMGVRIIRMAADA